MSQNRIDCDACAKRWPNMSNKMIELTQSTVYLHDDQFFPGWTVLVLKQHATELFHLPDEDRNVVMHEVSIVATALAEVFSAIKVNYALLGNMLPHMHWHVIPRLVNDPVPRDSPFNVSHVPVSLNPEARNLRVRVIREAMMAHSSVSM